MLKNKAILFFQIWGVILVLNQVFIFGACFAPYCIVAALPHTGVISFFIFIWFLKLERDDSKNKTEGGKSSQANYQKIFEKVENFEKEDPLKKKGDEYELYIGKQLEQKGYLVIYNGFIKGYEDKGVDIIAISLEEKLNLESLKQVYKKLELYDLDFYSLEAESINRYLDNKISSEKLESIFLDSKSYKIRKTLYIASENVIDLEIGEYLIMIKQNIFRYLDMKIVFI
jgi:hypothetical protein